MQSIIIITALLAATGANAVIVKADMGFLSADRRGDKTFLGAAQPHPNGIPMPPPPPPASEELAEEQKEKTAFDADEGRRKATHPSDDDEGEAEDEHIGWAKHDDADDVLDGEDTKLAVQEDADEDAKSAKSSDQQPGMSLPPPPPPPQQDSATWSGSSLTGQALTDKINAMQAESNACQANLTNASSLVTSSGAALVNSTSAYEQTKLDAASASLACTSATEALTALQVQIRADNYTLESKDSLTWKVVNNLMEEMAGLSAQVTTAETTKSTACTNSTTLATQEATKKTTKDTQETTYNGYLKAYMDLVGKCKMIAKDLAAGNKQQAAGNSATAATEAAEQTDLATKAAARATAYAAKAAKLQAHAQAAKDARRAAGDALAAARAARRTHLGDNAQNLTTNDAEMAKLEAAYAAKAAAAAKAVKFEHGNCAMRVEIAGAEDCARDTQSVYYIARDEPNADTGFRSSYEDAYGHTLYYSDSVKAWVTDNRGQSGDGKAVLYSKSDAWCPSFTTDWKCWNGTGWMAPAAPKPPITVSAIEQTLCPKEVTLSGTDVPAGYAGTYTMQSQIPGGYHRGRPMYESTSGKQIYYWAASGDHWLIDNKPANGTRRTSGTGIMAADTTAECPQHVSGWSVHDGSSNQASSAWTYNSNVIISAVTTTTTTRFADQGSSTFGSGSFLPPAPPAVGSSR